MFKQLSILRVKRLTKLNGVLKTFCKISSNENIDSLLISGEAGEAVARKNRPFSAHLLFVFQRLEQKCSHFMCKFLIPIQSTQMLNNKKTLLKKTNSLSKNL